MSNKPKVRVIVCHHVGTLLFDFLESLKRNCTLELEIVVITSDKELSRKGIKGCEVLYDTGMPAEKRNRGAVGPTDYLAIFDDDVEIEKGCIEEMVGFLECNHHVGMVYGKLHKFDEPHRFDEAGGFLTKTGFIWSRAQQNIPDTGQYDVPERIFAGKSASCMVRKSVWKELGGMDEDFGILGEESDLSWRMWIKGYEVWWIPQAVALHKFNTPLKPVDKHYTSERVQFNGCRNYLTMLIKNLGTSQLWIIPIHVMIWLIASLVMIGTGKAQQGKNIMRGVGFVLKNAIKIWLKRKEIQSGRKISDKSLRSIIFRTPGWSYYRERFCRYASQGLHG